MCEGNGSVQKSEKKISFASKYLIDKLFNSEKKHHE